LYAALAESRGSGPAAVRAAVGSGGQIDSLEGVELVVAAEVRYGVVIEDAELTQVCTSIPRLAELVASKMATAASTHPAGR
jgi:hypothetical protein